jgi:hypothetical protein
MSRSAATSRSNWKTRAVTADSCASSRRARSSASPLAAGSPPPKLCGSLPIRGPSPPLNLRNPGQPNKRKGGEPGRLSAEGRMHLCRNGNSMKPGTHSVRNGLARATGLTLETSGLTTRHPRIFAPLLSGHRAQPTTHLRIARFRFSRATSIRRCQARCLASLRETLAFMWWIVDRCPRTRCER